MEYICVNFFKTTPRARRKTCRKGIFSRLIIVSTWVWQILSKWIYEECRPNNLNISIWFWYHYSTICIWTTDQLNNFKYCCWQFACNKNMWSQLCVFSIWIILILPKKDNYAYNNSLKKSMLLVKYFISALWYYI